MKNIEYDRSHARLYALQWALKRNPNYYNFDGIGGDCTNFVSQCVFAGSNVMNYTNVTGWYYNSVNDRTASWTGVEFFYNFLTMNDSVGPFGKLVDKQQISVGDVIQLGRSSGNFYHNLFVSDVDNDQIFVCSHSYDALNKPLFHYVYERIRYIKILGVRTL